MKETAIITKTMAIEAAMMLNLGRFIKNALYRSAKVRKSFCYFAKNEYLCTRILQK